MGVNTDYPRMLMFKKNQNRDLLNSGFTLIELLVTITLSLLVTGGAMAAYNSFNTQQNHIQNSRNVIANIEQAKKRASVGDTPESCTRLDGYEVKATAGSNTYLVSVYCDGAASATEFDQFSMPTGYAFEQSFQVLFRPYPYDVAANDQTIDIQRNGSDLQYRFIILKRGAIEDVGVVDA